MAWNDNLAATSPLAEVGAMNGSIPQMAGSAEPRGDRFVRGGNHDKEAIGAACEGNEARCNLVEGR